MRLEVSKNTLSKILAATSTLEDVQKRFPEWLQASKNKGDTPLQMLLLAIVETLYLLVPGTDLLSDDIRSAFLQIESAVKNLKPK